MQLDTKESELAMTLSTTYYYYYHGEEDKECVMYTQEEYRGVLVSFAE